MASPPVKTCLFWNEQNPNTGVLAVTFLALKPAGVAVGSALPARISPAVSKPAKVHQCRWQPVEVSGSFKPGPAGLPSSFLKPAGVQRILLS